MYDVIGGRNAKIRQNTTTPGNICKCKTEETCNLIEETVEHCRKSQPMSEAHFMRVPPDHYSVR